MRPQLLCMEGFLGNFFCVYTYSVARRVSIGALSFAVGSFTIERHFVTETNTLVTKQMNPPLQRHAQN